MIDLPSSRTLESMSQAVWYNRWTLRKFTKYLSGDILEIGCGIGNFTKSLEEFGNVWAIDINNDYLKQTKKIIGKNTKIGFGNIENGEFFFGNKKFDSIVCINVLEHIKDDIGALENLYSLLNKGGFLILLVPIHEFLYSEIDKSIGHFRRYKRSDLIYKLERSGFNITESRVLNFLGAIGWLVSGKILQNRQVSGNKIKLFNLVSPIILRLEDLIESPIGTSILVIAKKD